MCHEMSTNSTRNERGTTPHKPYSSTMMNGAGRMRIARVVGANGFLPGSIVRISNNSYYIKCARRIAGRQSLMFCLYY